MISLHIDIVYGNGRLENDVIADGSTSGEFLLGFRKFPLRNMKSQNVGTVSLMLPPGGHFSPLHDMLRVRSLFTQGGLVVVSMEGPALTSISKCSSGRIPDLLENSC